MALDRILMIDGKDLSPILRDETEEQQKYFVHTANTLQSLLQSPFGGEQEPMFGGGVQNLFFHPTQLLAAQQ